MDIAAIKNILVVGAGTCGQQIALQFARFGFGVTLYDVNQASLDRSRRWHREWLTALAGGEADSRSGVQEICEAIAYESDLRRAASDADLLIESVPEDRVLKRRVFCQFHEVCPPKTIFTTNTSYLLPSSLATATGRPERFAAFHFHVPVWHANAVDVMPHPFTLPWVVNALCELALRIDQTPIRLRRESPGYVFNTMLGPLLMAGLDLAARKVADFEDIDRAWMAVTKMSSGPFGMVDFIGIETVYAIVSQWGHLVNRRQADGVAELLKSYLDRGLLGEKTGQGFYSYPHPVFAAPGFISQGTAGPHMPPNVDEE